MKYKDIISIFTQHSVKVKMALRIQRCSKPIRKEINEWLKTGYEPNCHVVLPVKDVHGEQIELSTKFLINNYGFSPLDALLFIDSATRTEKDAYKALSILSRQFKNELRPLSKEEWSRVDSDVIDAYNAIVRKEEETFIKEEKDYKTIAEEEINNE